MAREKLLQRNHTLIESQLYCSEVKTFLTRMDEDYLESYLLEVHPTPRIPNSYYYYYYSMIQLKWNKVNSYISASKPLPRLPNSSK